MFLQEPWIIGLLASHLLLLVLVLVFRKSWNLNLIIMVSAGTFLLTCIQHPAFRTQQLNPIEAT